jgi:hypothetical protein
MKYSKLFTKQERKYMYGCYMYLRSICYKNKTYPFDKNFEDYCGRCFRAVQFQKLAPLLIDDGC